MDDLFRRFLESPNRESYMAVRSALVSSEYYDPYSRETDAIEDLLEAGKLEAARERIFAAMPNLLLSPSVHFMLSFIAQSSQHQERAKLEEFIAVACCEGILSTGEGTKSEPYVVVRISDEYDILRYLGRQFRSQALIHDGDSHFDLLECDGSELWFDITDAFNRHQDVFYRSSR